MLDFIQVRSPDLKATLISELKEYVENRPYSCTITPGEAHTDTVNVAIQLLDYAGNDLAVAGSVIAYLSDVDTGLDITVTDVTTETAIGIDGSLAILTTKKVYLLNSEADGDIDIDVKYTTGAHDFYLVVILPSGKRVVSTKIEFTA